MITWYYGNTGAGKSMEAFKHVGSAVIIDGDRLRAITSNYDLSEAGRRRQNWTAAKLAQEFDMQGLDVVVATICPYRDQRAQIKEMIDCEFIYIGYDGDNLIPESPFERDHVVN